MGLEVVYKAFVGNDDVFLESVNTISEIDVDLATRVSDGEEGLFNDQLVWDFLEMDPRVLEVGHLFVEVVVDDVFRQVVGPFSVVGDDGVEVDLEVQ